MVCATSLKAWNEFVEMTEEEQSSFISPRAVLYDEGSDDDELEDSPTSTPPSQDTRNGKTYRYMR